MVRMFLNDRGEKVAEAVGAGTVIIGGALVRSAATIAVGLISTVVRDRTKPVIEFDTDFGTPNQIEEGSVMGIFAKRHPRPELCGACPSYVYTRAEALAYIARIPPTDIHWSDRAFLRFQVGTAGLPEA